MSHSFGYVCLLEFGLRGGDADEKGSIQMRLLAF